MSTMPARQVDSIKLLDHQPEAADVRSEVLGGLGSQPKRLPPKLFYDDNGSKLFEKITRLPEYYLTRTEVGIMTKHAGEMASLTGPHASLIEFGSGSSFKTRTLLDHLEEPAAYVPVDISKDHLLTTAEKLATEYPDLEILPVCADFTKTFGLPDPGTAPARNLVYFPGSTIGNLETDDAISLLGVMAEIANVDGAAIIGVDLIKDPRILEKAYNDESGVTAEFNLNLLSRINREFDANFNPALFEHQAVFDDGARRIEMRLVSCQEQTVTVDGEAFYFADGEFIVTEYSHKYSADEFSSMAGKAGFDVVRLWTDPDQLFSVQYLEVAIKS